MGVAVECRWVVWRVLLEARSGEGRLRTGILTSVAACVAGVTCDGWLGAADPRGRERGSGAWDEVVGSQV